VSPPANPFRVPAPRAVPRESVVPLKLQSELPSTPQYPDSNAPSNAPTYSFVPAIEYKVLDHWELLRTSRQRIRIARKMRSVTPQTGHVLKTVEWFELPDMILSPERITCGLMELPPSIQEHMTQHPLVSSCVAQSGPKSYFYERTLLPGRYTKQLNLRTIIQDQLQTVRTVLEPWLEDFIRKKQELDTDALETFLDGCGLKALPALSQAALPLPFAYQGPFKPLLCFHSKSLAEWITVDQAVRVPGLRLVWG
jgi:hypothetical protein